MWLKAKRKESQVEHGYQISRVNLVMTNEVLFTKLLIELVTLTETAEEMLLIVADTFSPSAVHHIISCTHAP